MRDINFRGKRLSDGEWSYGYYYSDCDAVGRAYFILSPKSNPDDSSRRYEVDPKTVGQYIGLRDRNSKEIFEGDIVEGNFNYEKVRGYIFYGSDAVYFIQREGLFGIGLNNAEDWVSVIGNIYDNPELMEVKADG